MSSSHDLLHGNRKSGYLVHYGTMGMQWGVRKERSTVGGRSVQKKDPQALDKKSSGAGVASSSRGTGSSAKTPTATTLAKGGGSSAGEGEEKEKVAEAKTSEEIYSAAFAKALGAPPITPEKIAAATKAAEKAVEDADLEGEDGEGGEEEKKGKGAGPKDLEAEKKEKEKKKREKIAKDRAASAVLAKEMVDGMAAELAGGVKRSPETLKREGLIVKAMLKQTKHNKVAYAELEAIGSRSFAESKGGERRSTEQLKADSAFVKKMGENFSKEADFIGNFGKKEEEQVKHGEDNMTDHLEHYGTKGMRWGVRKKAGAVGSKVKKGLIKNTEVGLFVKKERARRGQMIKDDVASTNKKISSFNKKAGAVGSKVKKGLIKNTEVGLFVKKERARRGQMIKDDVASANKKISSVNNKVNAYAKTVGSKTVKSMKSPAGQKTTTVGKNVVGVMIGAGIAAAVINAPKIGSAIIKYG